MNCKVCQSKTLPFASAKILNGKYNIQYFQCQNCGFIQTEEPYWLADAYSQAIAPSDEGLIFRNLMLAQITNNIISNFFNPEDNFLDFGGGYGLLVRLMRDIRYNFFWQDKYCQNLFAQGFEARGVPSYQLLTAFEVFEHLVNPLEEIKELLKYSRNILFSTELIPANNPKPDQWWYYALNEGQHISLYSLKSLSILAEKFGLNLYTNNSSIHLLTEKKISQELFGKLSEYNAGKLKEYLWRSRDYLKTLELLQPTEAKTNIPQSQSFISQKLGVNIAGFVKGELGIGEGVRATIRSIETTDISYVINNIVSTPHRNSDITYQEKFSQENPYPINIFQVNAHEVKTFMKRGAIEKYFPHRYNIGFWAWELPKFPPEWMPAFKPFNEIWTYSNYCVESISKVASVPVIKMMPSISLPIPTLGREALNLPSDKFIFLFIFDFFSNIERKNPIATVRAFKQAFGENNPDVLLVIKCSNSQRFPGDRARLIEAIANSPSIKLIDGYLAKEKINALLYNCDCYVSLHRAEGFGLTMSEAMYYGKPVIATGYSSNIEFMNLGNSFLVDYETVEIAGNYGPYKRGDIWANPSSEHCAQLMQYVFNNYQKAREVGARAAREIRSLLSPEARGEEIKKRLEYIAQLTDNFTSLPQPGLIAPSREEKPGFSVSQKPGFSPSQKPGFFKKPGFLTSPLVSICIPTFNGEAFIKEALLSASVQTYPNLEIIVADDSSTDKTVEIVREFQLENPDIDLRVILHRNYGLVGNLNFCISEARGKYIKFLFQDDLLAVNCIEEMVKIAESDLEIGLVFSPRKVFLEPGAESNANCMAAYRGTQDLHKDWSNLKTVQWGKELLIDANWMRGRWNKIGEPTTVLIRQDVFNNIGVFDASLTQLLDVDMWLRIMGNYKIGFANQTLSQLRIHPRQQTQINLNSGENPQDYRRFYRKLLEDSSYSFLGDELKEKVRQKLGISSEFNSLQITQLVEKYRKNPLNESGLNNLRQYREKLAKQLLDFTSEELNKKYLGDWGNAYKALVNSGIKNEPLNQGEKAFLDSIAAVVVRGWNFGNSLQYFLAFILYKYAYQLPVNYQRAPIPRWLFADFLQFIFETPSSFQQKEELDGYCQYMQGLIDYMRSNALTNTNQEVRQSLAAFIKKNIDLTPLYLQDLPLGDIWKKLADIWEFALQNEGHQLDYNFPSITTSKRGDRSLIRIGFLLDKLSPNQQTFAIIALIKYLDRQKFDLVVYNLKVRDDIVAQYCQKLAVEIVQLPETLPQQAERIRRDDLDLLWIGADPTAIANQIADLALHRLARVQLIPGTTAPDSTGIRNLDYYILGDLTLQPESQQQYREELKIVEGSGFCFESPLEGQAEVKPTRQSWGASADATVFASGAAISQIGPELREAWAKILEAVPNSVLVLYPFGERTQDYAGMLLLKQMRSLFAQFGLDKKRLVVIKRLKSNVDVRECLKLADVYLDSFPWSGAASLVEPLLEGVPTAVKEGQTARGRQGAAMLRELGLAGLVANSERNYIKLSIELGTNPELRQRYAGQIKQKMAATPIKLDSRSYALKMGSLLENVFKIE
jgi:predicted O-linked N-acetylglucosamine transferase (SPINDLY family)/glycosyltransferase involved in cell wall biosynthesis